MSSDHTVMVTNSRHKALLVQTRDILKRLLRDIKKRVPPEFIILDVKEGIRHLGEITGETIDAEILDKIFSKFCIGK